MGSTNETIERIMGNGEKNQGDSIKEVQHTNYKSDKGVLYPLTLLENSDPLGNLKS